ncbi:MAG TPA: mandelate racemase/muconate lactonizing enzyme family protein [Pirellula sp.]|nr:mandelate racemase/muconate lactonizing enzyme family protein [Pirellula sp.]
MTQFKNIPFARRELLNGVGYAAAGFALVNHAMGQGDAPGAQVADRASTIKITGMKTYWVGPIVYVKIETNHGIFGWGDLKGTDVRVGQVLAQSLFELINGENPTRIEHLWQKMFRAHRDIRGGAIMIHAMAAIDIALWDIAGKLWNTPVYRLLGGPTRDRIRVYHSPKAIKVPPHGIYDHSGTPADIERMTNAIKVARERVGPTGAVMFDAHSAVPPATLIQLASALKPYDLLFIEEPGVPGNIEIFKRLKEKINIPLATGERDRTIYEMIPYLHERCIDILQPDCCHTGGISQMRKIATLAEAYYVPLAPHCTATFLGIAASLHVVSSIPLFLIHEFYPENAGFNLPGVTKMAYELDKDGYVGLPPGPGLGVEVDEPRLIEESSKPQKYKWPGAVLKDGSVADY